MNSLLALIKTLAALLEEAARAGLVREVAIYFRRRRYADAESALEARNDRLARALVEGDVGELDALVVDLERDLDVVLPGTAAEGGHRREERDTPPVDR